MKASATVVVARDGDRDIVVDQRCAAPLSVRQCAGRILLVSSAAAPVGGDELHLDIDVGPGARADVGSVASSIVWPGVGGAPSSTTTRAVVRDGGHLDLRLEPTISVQGSHHRTTTLVRLDPDATCRVVEETVLGRRGEPSGRLDLSIRVERAGRALVHHDEAFGPCIAGALSSVSVGAARHVISAIVVGGEAATAQVCVDTDRAAALLPVASDAVVTLAIGHDRSAAMEALGRIGASFA